MSDPRYDRGRRRRAVNLSVDAGLLAEARRLELNLSRLFEERLAAAVAEARESTWISENRPAIEDYNRLVEDRGSYGDRRRRF